MPRPLHSRRGPLAALRPARVRRFVSRHPLDRRGHEAALLSVTALVIAVAAVVAMVLIAGPHAVAHDLANARWPWLPAALGGIAVSYLGYVLAYREVACLAGCEWLSGGDVAALVATGFTPFLPAGGFRFDARVLRRMGARAQGAEVHVAVLGVLEYAVLAPATAAAAVALLVAHVRTEGGVTLSWVIGVPAGTVLVLLALPFAERIRRRGRTGRAVGRMLGAVTELRRLARTPGVALRAGGGMTLYWLGEIFALWACLTLFTRTGFPGVPVVIVGYATGYALTRRALPLAGAGITEVLVPFAMTWVGVPLAPAVLAVAAYRVFNMWLPLAPGVAGLTKLQAPRRHRAVIDPG